MSAMPDFASYPTTRHALAAALGFYDCGSAHELAMRLGVESGIPLLAILGIPDRSPLAIDAAAQIMEGSVMFGVESEAWQEGVARRARFEGRDLPRPPQPTIPAVPLVLAPVPGWLGWYTPPDGSVATPSVRIVVLSGQSRGFRLALDFQEFKPDQAIVQYTDPLQLFIRHRFAAPLPQGQHYLSIWYDDEAGSRQLYTWAFTCRDEFGALPT